jgi:hypothetical protein
MERIKIHVDSDDVKPVVPGNKCITVCTMEGRVLQRGERVTLHGTWVLRQYRNPVPCGASVVLYTEDLTSTYEMR